MVWWYSEGHSSGRTGGPLLLSESGKYKQVGVTSFGSLESCQQGIAAGFTRVGNTSKCQKTFGTSKPDCSQYGASAKLDSREIAGGRFVIFSCQVDMV